MMKEAEVLSEKVVEKPEILVPEVIVKGTTQITNNIKEVHKSVIALKEYYSILIFTEDNLNVAKTEKANVNKCAEEIKTHRIATVSSIKKEIGLDEFEEECKATEKDLKETYDIINNQCLAYDNSKKEKILNEAKEYLSELCVAKEIPFEIPFEKTGVKIGLSTSQKKIHEGIDSFIELVLKDLITIETFEHKDEILVEYQKNLDFAESVKEIHDRYEAISKIQESSPDKTGESPVNSGPAVLQAPKEIDEVLGQAIFKVVASRAKLKKLVGFMKEEGIEYEQIKQ